MKIDYLIKKAFINNTWLSNLNSRFKIQPLPKILARMQYFIALFIVSFIFGRRAEGKYDTIFTIIVNMIDF